MLLDFVRIQNEKTVGPGCKPTLDAEDIAEGQLAGFAQGHRCGKLRPFARMLQRVNRYAGLTVRTINRAGKREPRMVPWRWRRFAKHYHSRGDERIGELRVGGAEAVDMQQGHALGKIAAQSGSIVTRHEFRRHKPDSKPLLFHPV